MAAKLLDVKPMDDGTPCQSIGCRDPRRGADRAHIAVVRVRGGTPLCGEHALAWAHSTGRSEALAQAADECEGHGERDRQRVRELELELAEARAWISAFKEWQDVTIRLLHKVAIEVPPGAPA